MTDCHADKASVRSIARGYCALDTAQHAKMVKAYGIAGMSTDESDRHPGVTSAVNSEYRVIFKRGDVWRPHTAWKFSTHCIETVAFALGTNVANSSPNLGVIHATGDAVGIWVLRRPPLRILLLKLILSTFPLDSTTAHFKQDSDTVRYSQIFSKQLPWLEPSCKLP